jgi:hypothetical protein
VTDLPITAVTVALPVNGSAGVSAIQPATLQQVTFSGQKSFDIPNGSLVVSDPLKFPVKAQSMLTITIFLETGQQGTSITSHPGSRTTSFFVNGNSVNAATFPASAANVSHWYF